MLFFIPWYDLLTCAIKKDWFDDVSSIDTNIIFIIALCFGSTRDNLSACSTLGVQWCQFFSFSFCQKKCTLKKNDLMMHSVKKKPRPKKIVKSNKSISWKFFLTNFHFFAISKMAKYQFLLQEKVSKCQKCNFTKFFCDYFSHEN